jgi:hypothetical protein
VLTTRTTAYPLYKKEAASTLGVFDTTLGPSVEDNIQGCSSEHRVNSLNLSRCTCNLQRDDSALTPQIE